MKSSHGHVEEIKEKKKTLCKAKEKPEVLQEKKRAVTTVDEGSTRNRVAFRFTLEE